MSTFASKIIQFNKQLSFEGKLPEGISIMNPFKENAEIMSIVEKFYNKFYNDDHKRKIILGINPGRLGGGVTGIPFTDSKRLTEVCNIKIDSVKTHEPSSVFIYEMIHKYGGVEKFYSHFYINSICPLGFIQTTKTSCINKNYYDYDDLYQSVESFMISTLRQQIDFGIDTKKCFVLGKRNAGFISKINEKEKLFNSIVVLEHPRYIQQYKSKEKDNYISRYLDELSN